MKGKWTLPENWNDKIAENREDLLRWLLQKRGITAEPEIAEFFDEKPRETHDPFLLKGMEAAVELILDALQQKKHICIYGDYDADGVTASSLLFESLSPLGASIEYYIPSRFEEGYGLNMSAVEGLAAKGVQLLITVDCGSVSGDEVKRAKELGMEVIVTDHHSIPLGREADCVLINPKQPECSYPFKELSGCGVAFKLVQALQRTMQRKTEQGQTTKRQNAPLISKRKLNSLLDLVAISTIGDIVPLVGENRTLVKYGLRTLNQGDRQGLALLLKEIGLKRGQVTATDVAFRIVPHLNAGGRMQTAKTGVEVLLGQGDVKKAVALLIANNKERKALQESTYHQCLELAREEDCISEFLLIEAPDAHEGIAGIVAGKIKDYFGKPTVLVTNTNEQGTLKGTGRSVEGINLFEILNGYRKLFLRFGGHAGACGFSIEEHKLALLREGIQSDMRALLEKKPDLLEQKVEISAVISPKILNLDLVETIGRLEPFGFGNEKPIFMVEKITVSGVKYMGEAKQHVRFSGIMSDGCCCDFVLFGQAQEWKELLESGESIDIAGYLDVNVWNGRRKIQFMVRDGRRTNGRTTKRA